MEPGNETNCSLEMDLNCSNSTEEAEIDILKAGSLLLIFVIALIGNLCTVILVSRFKIHKVPDILVIGLALTDLGSTVIPIPMTLYSYITLNQFAEDSFACNFYATLAQFTRFSSVWIVTLVAIERYLAVNKPFIYRKYTSPKKFVGILIVCWIIAFVLAIAPALDKNTPVIQHDGYCLFSFTTSYAISVPIWGGIQFIIVFICFVLVSAKLIRVSHRRKKLKVSEKRSKSAGENPRRLTNKRSSFSTRISDLGRSLRRAAPFISEKFHLGVEAQFARMLFAVVVLFYVSWTLIVSLVVVALIRGSEEGLGTALFWGIRLTVVSTAINPLLYGILARQYRLAYFYVGRLSLSKCCSCVDPPLKDIFHSARNVGGELHGETRSLALRKRRLDESHYSSSKHSHTPAPPSNHTQTVSPYTNHSKLSPATGQLHDSNEYLIPSLLENSVEVHSTHVPSAGELSSSVIIPLQARDRQSPRTMEERQKKDMRFWASVEDFAVMDYVPQPPPGSLNPLALIANAEGESAVRSPLSLSSRGSEVDTESLLRLGSAGKGKRLDRSLEPKTDSVPLAGGGARAPSPLSVQVHSSNKVLQLGKPVKKPVRAASMEESVAASSGPSPKRPLRAAITVPPTLPSREVGSGLEGREMKKSSTKREAAILPATHEEREEVAICMEEQLQDRFDGEEGLVRNTLSGVGVASIPDTRTESSAVRSQTEYGVESEIQRSHSQDAYDMESDTQRFHSQAEYDMESDSQASHSQANGVPEILPVYWQAKVNNPFVTEPATKHTELKEEIEAPPLPSDVLEPRRLSATNNSDSGRESMVFDPDVNSSSVAVGIETVASQ